MAQFGKREFVERKHDYSGPSVRRSEGVSLSMPDIHNSHLEKYWPAYLAVVAGIGVGYYGVSQGKTDAFQLVLSSVLGMVISFFMFRGVRKSLNQVHAVRTARRRSPAFKLGMLAGFGCWVYSTFIAPTKILGKEWGVQTALYDGIQFSDMGAIVSLMISAAIYAAVGGFTAVIIKRRFSRLVNE